MKDLARGRSSGFQLLRLAFALNRSCAIVPPVNYLFRTNRLAAASALPQA